MSKGAFPDPSRRTARSGWRYLILGLAAVVGLVPGRALEAQEGIAIGATPAPILLESLEGESVDLGEVIGTRPVLLEFWATWCAVCRALAPEIEAAHEEYGDRVEFVVVAAGVAQTPESVRRHLDRHPMPGRVVWDGEGEAVRAFEAPGTGYVVILDASGSVAYTGTGADQNLRGALKQVTGDSADRSPRP